MANQPRTRKRVHAIRRSSDGSAFQKWYASLSLSLSLSLSHGFLDTLRLGVLTFCSNLCGVSVAVALADMHECESKKNAKRFKGECMNRNNVKQREIFLKSCKARNRIEVDRKGFETWRNMSKKERLPYVLQAEKVNSVYTRGLLQEVEDMAWADDEADSAEVGKYDKYYEDDSENSDGYERFWSVSSETDVLYCDPFPFVKFKSRARASNWEQ
ncbi:hypothetical protein RHSIM_Rhsim09G0183800 [Rhododendron simsii]|uniref:Uncharacterized protein n=1 Tax=Rhododendron simsii TaxID=118357 RepID=A0A834LET4_RHOSS|nr:hypothetical protein RHSIM_Rhsim09G0183800 [Rhododendron simsii]